MIRKPQMLQNDVLRICECIRDPRGINIDALHTRNKIPKLLPDRNRELLKHHHKLFRDAVNVITPANKRGSHKVKLKVPCSKKAVFDRSPLYRGKSLWDELAPETQRLSPEAFAIHMKNNYT